MCDLLVRHPCFRSDAHVSRCACHYTHVSYGEGIVECGFTLADLVPLLPSVFIFRCALLLAHDTRCACFKGQSRTCDSVAPGLSAHIVR